MQTLSRALLAAALACALCTPALAGTLLVANGVGDSVFSYDTTASPSSPTVFVASGSGGLNDPRGLAFGPDGNLYVVAGNIGPIAGPFVGQIFRYDGANGASLGTFATTNDDPAPFGLKFGPDGNLYVVKSATGAIERFNGATGASLGNFVAAGSLSAPRDLVFGPDGNLYVANPGILDTTVDEVRRYNGATGAFIDVFASGVDARGLAFGPGGDLYVADFLGDVIRRFDGSTGAAEGVFASGGGLDGPVGVTFGDDGILYVSSFNSDAILRYDAATGTFIDVFASGNGLDQPRLMLFVAQQAPEPATFGLLLIAGVLLVFSARMAPLRSSSACRDVENAYSRQTECAALRLMC